MMDHAMMTLAREYRVQRFSATIESRSQDLADASKGDGVGPAVHGLAGDADQGHASVPPRQGESDLRSHLLLVKRRRLLSPARSFPSSVLVLPLFPYVVMLPRRRSWTSFLFRPSNLNCVRFPLSNAVECENSGVGILQMLSLS